MTNLVRCEDCEWAAVQGPHLGCYFENKWRKWVKRNKLRKCDDFKREMSLNASG